MEAQAIVSTMSPSEVLVSSVASSWGIPSTGLPDYLIPPASHHFQLFQHGLTRTSEPSVTISHRPQDPVSTDHERAYYYNPRPPNCNGESGTELGSDLPEDPRCSPASLANDGAENTGRQSEHSLRSGTVFSENENRSSPEAEPGVDEKPDVRAEPNNVLTRASVIGIAYSSNRDQEEGISGSVDSPPKSESSDRCSDDGGETEQRHYEHVGSSPSDQVIQDYQQQVMTREEYAILEQQHQQMQALALHQQSEYQNLSGFAPMGGTISPNTMALQQQQLELQYQHALQQAQAYDPAYYAAYDPKTAGLQYPYAAGSGATYYPPTPPFNSPQGYGNPQQVYRYDAPRWPYDSAGNTLAGFEGYTGGLQRQPSNVDYACTVLPGGQPSAPNESPVPSQQQTEECAKCGNGQSAYWTRDGGGNFICQTCILPPQPKTSTGSQSGKPKRPKQSTSGQRRQGLVCANCNTTTTTLWRRNNDGEPVCNACGLYYKLHQVQRPMSMKKDGIQTRKRKTKTDGRSSKKHSTEMKNNTSRVSLEAQALMNNPLLSNQLPNPTAAIPFTTEMGGGMPHHPYSLESTSQSGLIEAHFNSSLPVVSGNHQNNTHVVGGNDHWLGYHDSTPTLSLATPERSPVEDAQVLPPGGQFGEHQQLSSTTSTSISFESAPTVTPVFASGVINRNVFDRKSVGKQEVGEERPFNVMSANKEGDTESRDRQTELSLADRSVPV